MPLTVDRAEKVLGSSQKLAIYDHCVKESKSSTQTMLKDEDFSLLSTMEGIFSSLRHFWLMSYINDLPMTGCTVSLLYVLLYD